MTQLPISVQKAIWDESVRAGEALFLPLREERPDIPPHRTMLITTLMVRWMHETTLDTITPLPVNQWATADPHPEIDLLEMVFTTWIDPEIKQAFDATIDTLDQEMSYLRAASYEPQLQVSLPADVPERADTIAFLVEVDRRFFQLIKARDLPDSQKLYDRLRSIIDQWRREVTEVMQDPLAILQRSNRHSKGFGKPNPRAKKRDLN